MTLLTNLVQLPHLPSPDAYDAILFGNRSGIKPWEQLYERVPAISPLFFQWEKSFGPNQDVVSLWFYTHMAFPICLSLAYIIAVFGGQYLMKSRQPFGLRTALGAWNLFLAGFSLICAIRTLPQLLLILAQGGFYESVCGDAFETYGLGASGFWTLLFIASKVPELVDTAFIVLRKTTLIFLHWYHHVTVLLFCWHSYATRSGSGLWFVTMNSIVHSLMYYYYYRVATTPKDRRPKWDWIVTTFQISQMFIGIVVCIATYVYWSRGYRCYVHRDNWIWAFLMYSSYLLLFLHFAFGKYCLGGKKSKSKDE